MAEELFLLCISVETSKKVYDRCLVLSYIPNSDDLLYYYRTLLEFKDARVSVTAEPIPADFNVALLPNLEGAPSDFPMADLETNPEDSERREKYRNFLTQLCTMERSRASLKVFSRAPKPQKYTTALTEDPIHLIGYAAAAQGEQRRAWVQEILKELSPDAEDDSLVVASSPENPPAGWLLTPAAPSARYAKGCRILVDPALGMKWEKLLGTDLYPDLLVTRRLSSRGWAFQGKQSEALVEATVQWFIASQDATVENGLTSYIIGAEKELSALFSTFQQVRVSNRILESAGDDNPQSRVLRFLQTLESQALESAESNSDIQPISGAVFHKFLSYLFRAAGIPRDAYTADDNVRATVERWVASQFGFKEGAECVLPKWKNLWDLVMRGKPSAIRVNHFLASMDVWDPVMATSYRRNIERPAIAQEWIRIFLDTQLIRETNSKIRSVTLHENIRSWCLQFLPEEMFGPQFAPVNVGPTLTKKGFVSVKMRDGRYILGYKLREEAKASEEMPVSLEETVHANTVVYSETKTTPEGNEVKNETAVHHSVTEEEDGTIERFLYTSSTSSVSRGAKETTTIDLGKI